MIMSLLNFKRCLWLVKLKQLKTIANAIKTRLYEWYGNEKYGISFGVMYHRKRRHAIRTI